jgi:hypothetical protein
VREISIAAVIAINLFIGIRYCWLIRAQKIRPALAMWTFFTIAVAGSLVTYLSEGDFNLLDNILNSTDLLLVLSVSTAILVYGDRSTRFSRFDRGCLIAVLAIVVFWVFTQNHAVAHLSIQAILIIAYFPVVKRLWTADENTESFAAWIGMCLAPAISLLSSRGTLARVYSLRAILCTGALLLLMLRVEWRKRKAAAARPGRGANSRAETRTVLTSTPTTAEEVEYV